MAHHDVSIANRVASVLRHVGYTVTLAFTSDEAIRSSRAIEPALLIIDPIMRGLSGLEAGNYIAQQINCRILFLTDLAADKDFADLLGEQFRGGVRCAALPTSVSDEDLITFVRSELGPAIILTDSESEECRAKQGGEAASHPERSDDSDEWPSRKAIAPQDGAANIDALFSISKSNLYQANAFRLTGLPVTATAREVRRAYQEFCLSKELKRSWAPDPFVPYLTNPSDEDRETAFQQINHPEQRLLQEFFWFWFDTRSDKESTVLNRDMDQYVREWRVRTGVNDPQGVADHNLAVFNHLMALQTESVQLMGRSVVAPDFWKEAFRHWRLLASNSRFWDGFIERIRAFNDPRVAPDLAERLWASLPEGILYINAELAVRAAERGDFPEAARQRQLMYGSGFDSRDADKALNRALAPLLDNLSVLCSQARSQVEASPRHGLEIVQAFDASKSPLLKTLNCLVGANDPRRDAAHDEVATTIRGCLIDYVNSTRDWTAALPVFENCLALAQEAALRSTIAEDIVVLHGNLAAQHAEHRYTSQSTPSGNSNSTTVSGQYRAAARPRSSSGIAQRIGFGIGRAWKEMPVLGRALLVVLVLGLIVVIFNMMSNGGDSSAPPSSSTTDSSPNISPSTASGSDTSTATPSEPASNEPPNSPSSFTPVAPSPASTDDAELDAMKRDIEESRSRLASMETELQSIDSELNDYQAKIDSEKATLTQMESDSSSGLEVNRDDYEQIRQLHNQNVDRFNEEVERHNELLRAYRALLADTNGKIDRYNSMVKSQ